MGIPLETVCDSATTTCAKAFLTYINVIMPAADVLAADVYGTGVFHLHIVPRSGFGGLGVACWPLIPKFAGSNPAEAVGFLRAKKSSARLPSEGK